MPAQVFAAHLLAALAKAGIRNFFLAPGARSQALAIAAACALVAGVLAAAGFAVWRDLTPEEKAVIEPVLNPRLGLLIMISMVGAGAAAVLMKSFAQSAIAEPALLADEVGLIVGTDPSRRVKPAGSPELQRIAEAVNNLADQRRSLQEDVEARIREARLSVEEERNASPDVYTRPEILVWKKKKYKRIAQTQREL